LSIYSISIPDNRILKTFKPRSISWLVRWHLFLVNSDLLQAKIKN